VFCVLARRKAVSLSSFRRNDPQIRLACVLLEIYINRGKHDPLSVRRDHRLSYALERHHVFKGERPFRAFVSTLSPGRRNEYANERKFNQATPCSRAMHVSSHSRKSDLV